MEQLVDQIKKRAEDINSTDISHDELGTTSGFHEAEQSKKGIVEFIDRILKLVTIYRSNVDPIVLEEHLNQILAIQKQAQQVVTQIDQLVQAGVHQPQFPTQRDGFLKSMRNNLVTLKKQLRPLEAELRIAKIEELILNDDTLQQFSTERHNLFDQLKNSVSESLKILGNLRDQSMQHGLSRAVTNFASLADIHAWREKVWLIAFLASSFVTLLAVIYSVIVAIDATTLSDVVNNVFRRLLLIFTPAIFLKIALSKYNLERNLRIIYNHRDTVLQEYRNFENAIGDDLDAKNRFRLEITKYVFSDPVTGYIDANKTSEVTINPIMGAIERVSQISSSS